MYILQKQEGIHIMIEDFKTGHSMENNPDDWYNIKIQITHSIPPYTQFRSNVILWPDVKTTSTHIGAINKLTEYLEPMPVIGGWQACRAMV